MVVRRGLLGRLLQLACVLVKGTTQLVELAICGMLDFAHQPSDLPYQVSKDGRHAVQQRSNQALPRSHQIAHKPLSYTDDLLDKLFPLISEGAKMQLSCARCVVQRVHPHLNHGVACMRAKLLKLRLTVREPSMQKANPRVAPVKHRIERGTT